MPAGAMAMNAPAAAAIGLKMPAMAIAVLAEAGSDVEAMQELQ